jgi:hypothetical protein
MQNYVITEALKAKIEALLVESNTKPHYRLGKDGVMATDLVSVVCTKEDLVEIRNALKTLVGREELVFPPIVPPFSPSRRYTDNPVGNLVQDVPEPGLEAS